MCSTTRTFFVEWYNRVPALVIECQLFEYHCQYTSVVQPFINIIHTGLIQDAFVSSLRLSNTYILFPLNLIIHCPVRVFFLYTDH